MLATHSNLEVSPRCVIEIVCFVWLKGSCVTMQHGNTLDCGLSLLEKQKQMNSADPAAVDAALTVLAFENFSLYHLKICIM